MDATNGISSIVNLILTGLGDMFSLLDSFTFSGISLLDFMITIFVLGAVLPIILAIVSSRSSGDISNVRSYVKSSNHSRGVDE